MRTIDHLRHRLDAAEQRARRAHVDLAQYRADHTGHSSHHLVERVRHLDHKAAIAASRWRAELARMTLGVAAR